MKIGLFGGTFNPIHNGHINLALFYKEKLKLDKVIFMPTSTPPHKIAGDLASDEHRVNMLKLALAKFDGFEISTLEIQRKGKSYTYDTVCQLKKLYPNDQLYLIIGSDMFLSFDRWYKWQEILNNVTLCTAYRENDDTFNQMNSYAKTNLKLNENQYYIGVFSPLVISSTDIRNSVKNNKSLEKLVPKSVEEYIVEKGLYGD